ncbi:hypothetical protein [Herbaspirillum camelliae]|uniref:hypothetical protein n=1 Tax=Herbaspirillum camelliae TaxID=1892903 RepID=UPI00094A1283|nr:hypothetical protein [Herbaspirillum camelliae]
MKETPWPTRSRYAGKTAMVARRGENFPSSATVTGIFFRRRRYTPTQTRLMAAQAIREKLGDTKASVLLEMARIERPADQIENVFAISTLGSQPLPI